MIEDKLLHDERVRLECLCQANNTAPNGSSADQILARARKFELFIKEGAF